VTLLSIPCENEVEDNNKKEDLHNQGEEEAHLETRQS
jgi:hypothetical protein